jgi:hypothetical protein
MHGYIHIRVCVCECTIYMHIYGFMHMYIVHTCMDRYTQTLNLPLQGMVCGSFWGLTRVQLQTNVILFCLCKGWWFSGLTGDSRDI